MRARTLPLLAAIWALLFALVPQVALAQARANHIAARLVAEGPVEPGKPLTLAIAFDPQPAGAKRLPHGKILEEPADHLH